MLTQGLFATGNPGKDTAVLLPLRQVIGLWKSPMPSANKAKKFKPYNRIKSPNKNMEDLSQGGKDPSALDPTTYDVRGLTVVLLAECRFCY